MKRKSNYVLGRTLALALALLLTLGNLPLISFAEGVTIPEEHLAKPDVQNGEVTLGEIKSEIFLILREHDGSSYRYGTFWPEWKDAIRGKLYYYKIDYTDSSQEDYDLFTKLKNDNTSHFYPEDSNFSDFADKKVTHRFIFDDLSIDTGYFAVEKIREKEFFRDNLLPVIKTKLDGGDKLIMLDHNKNKVSLDPEDLLTDEYNIAFFRYANLVKTIDGRNFDKLHLDVYIERPDAGDITIIEQKPGEVEAEKTFKDKIGRIIDLDKEGYKVEGYNRIVEVWNGTEYVAYDETANPIIFGDKNQRFKITYQKPIEHATISIYHVLDQQNISDSTPPSKTVVAEVGKPYDFTPEKKDGFAVKSILLDNTIKGVESVTIEDVISQGHKIVVYYVSNSDISFYRSKDGEETFLEKETSEVGNFIGYTPAEIEGYEIEGIYLGDQKIADKKLEDYKVEKAEYKFVVKYKEKNQGGNPGGDNNNPGGDNNNPGGDNNNPGGDNNNPGGDNNNPGGDNNNPGGDNNNPGGDNNNPGGDNNNPGGDNNNPGGDNNNPGGNNNNNNNDNTDNRDRYEYQEYNPDKENVIIKDDKAPLGQLNTDSYYAYIQGYPDGSVKPGAYVSRQETAAIFFRLLNPSYRETIRTDENSFSDVDKNTWSNKHISTLAKGGIIVGYEDGTFKPKQIITRAELISIASKFDELDGNANHNFKDVAGHWAEKQIAAAAQKGTISGYLNGEFAPDKPVTRAEFAKIVNKVLNRSVKKAEVLPGVKQFTDLQSDMWYYEDMVTATNSYNATRGDDGYQKWTELIKIFIEM